MTPTLIPQSVLDAAACLDAAASRMPAPDGTAQRHALGDVRRLVARAAPRDRLAAIAASVYGNRRQVQA